jgi:hypothetical protein
MRKHKSKISFVCSFMAALLVISVPLSAKEEYRARMLNKAGLFDDRMINIRIKIEEYTTPEEVRQMIKTINEKGFNQFLNEFRETNKGVINFLGNRGMNVRINAAQFEPTDNGKKIKLYMERQTWATDTTIRIDSKYLFMVVELDVDIYGKGKGNFYKGANINFKGDGTLEMESSNPPMPLNGVRKK